MTVWYGVIEQYKVALVASRLYLLAHTAWKCALAVHFDTEYGGVLTQAGASSKACVSGRVGDVGNGFAAALKQRTRQADAARGPNRWYEFFWIYV